jgi:alpha-beta hydrolase superfamily lysophospholipase
MPERIQFQTQDGVTITGEWSPSPTMIGAVLLVHAMPETRAAWTPMIPELVKRGLGALAIDLRGHGDSIKTQEGDVLDYKKFQNEDSVGMVFDVMAGVEWLRGRGIELSRIVLCGASVGANLCVRALTENPRIPGAVLLSPGADYHGFHVLEDAANLLPDQALMIVSSEDDAGSFQSSRDLYAQAPVDTKIFTPYKVAGHGTALFSSDKTLLAKSAAWLSDIVKG